MSIYIYVTTTLLSSLNTFECKLVKPKHNTYSECKFRQSLKKKIIKYNILNNKRYIHFD